MQVYRFLDIGTSKPTPAQQEAVPHHLLSIINPDEEFSAAQFKKRAGQAIHDITARGLTPLVVGGTGLYIRALTRGLCAAPGKSEELRHELKHKAQTEGKDALFKLLQKKDPLSAQRISPNDTVRIIRALEVWYLTGVPISDHHRSHGFQESPYETLKIGLHRDRKELYQRIEQRVDRMIADGLREEVTSVLNRGHAPQVKSLQSIGYKQMVSFIQGLSSWDEAVSQIKKATKRLAKRQLTWFRHDPEIVWIKLPEQAREVPLTVKNFLKLHVN